jgi:cytochrome c
MIRPLRSRNALTYLALLTIGAGSAFAADNSGAAIDGKAALEKNCGRCHSIEATGESPLKGAPPLREVYLRYPIEQLEEGFAEGMGSRHRDMPQIQFSPEQVSGILNYLGSITGIAPSQRPPAAIPDETEPP